MKTPQLLQNYDPREEKYNVWTHALGAIFSLIAGIALIIKGADLPTLQWLALWVYAASMVLLFSCSTLYHLATAEDRRFFYKKLDHIAIYYLIVGTYTPFLAIALATPKAKILLIALWLIALIGTVFKLVFIYRFQKFSLIAYLLMGWAVILLIEDMQRALSPAALQLLVLGGLAYTVGAIFYALKKIKYTHAIWHLFVLIGAAAQFFCIYLYVI